MDVQFPNVDWSFLRSTYGWAALQHQAWIRGHLKNNYRTERRVSLCTDGILELWVNGQHYWGGDFYSFRRAPIVIPLQTGDNLIDVRSIHDVRAMGGGEPPTISVLLEAHITADPLFINADTAIVPDLVEGTLLSRFASVIGRNELEEDIDIISIESEATNIEAVSSLPLRLIGGQSRPISFSFGTQLQLDVVHSKGGLQLDGDGRLLLPLTVTYRLTSNEPQANQQQSITLTLQCRLLHEPQKFTFLHPGGTTSYAILRPPSAKAQMTDHFNLPVIIHMHGPGLEPDNLLVRQTLDDAPDIAAWTLYPTGMSPWSGDDWHTWGFADVQAAVAAIPSWLDAMQWRGHGVDIDRWFVTGHSNGGQGTWFVLTHQPDKVIAAAPVSGYSSIQNYVPYTTWNDADPRASSILHTSLNSFRHEMLAPNFDGIPILQQHGSADDNVPAYNSRLMSELQAHATTPSKYVELPNEGHWFQGVMTTPPLKRFYEEQLEENQLSESRLPLKFTILCPNSYDMGCRGGICVDQLVTPDMLGRLEVIRQDEQNWSIKTSNIHRFHLDPGNAYSSSVEKIAVDGSDIQFPSIRKDKLWLVRSSADRHWEVSLQNYLLWIEGNSRIQVSSDESWQSLGQRYGKQIGAMDAFLRTTSSFSIKVSGHCMELALQLSRNFLQYYGADSNILRYGDEHTDDHDLAGNEIIILDVGNMNPSAPPDFPVQVNANSISVRDSDGHITEFPKEPGLGGIFLQPLDNERLQLVIWGADVDGLRQAGRLVPMLAGGGQPDFIILGESSRWKGHGGALAMGFFDYQWNTSKASLIT